MAKKKNRYRDFERTICTVLAADALLFVGFLLSAGGGIAWLKVTCAIIAILTAILAIGFLFLTGELLRSRSLWMSVGFAAIILVIIVSLICNYPSPNVSPEGFNPAAVGSVLLH